ncbi:MAG: DEAD/DEAH box helicase [Myxococcales bacterium]|nr:DEAD/DEAH box helicase [Myxococcales bacterium]
MTSLPIDALRPAYLAHRPHHPLVVSAPTGSGKSTQIPRWSAAAGPVLVIEPRRVACQSLAARVAELEATPLGHHVGYRVRDDDRSRPDTHLLFATPGVALRMIQSDPTLSAFTTLILDEFHERSLDTDLLFALLAHRRREALVVMSATLDADRIAAHLDARHLHGEGRMYPVTERHIPGDTTLPDPRGLEHRLLQALRAAADDPGDILVFLPGKAEIAAATAALRAAPEHRHHTLVPSTAPSPSTNRPAPSPRPHPQDHPRHQRRRDLDHPPRRRRRHRRRPRPPHPLPRRPRPPHAPPHRPRRRGPTRRPRRPNRARRLLPPLEPRRPPQPPPPEIHRESLVPLLLAAAACDAPITRLPFLDPPAAHALATARDELTALGALDPDAPEATPRLTPAARPSSASPRPPTAASSSKPPPPAPSTTPSTSSPPSPSAAPLPP